MKTHISAETKEFSRQVKVFEAINQLKKEGKGIEICLNGYPEIKAKPQDIYSLFGLDNPYFPMVENFTILSGNSLIEDQIEELLFFAEKCPDFKGMPKGFKKTEKWFNSENAIDFMEELLDMINYWIQNPEIYLGFLESDNSLGFWKIQEE